LTSRASSHPAAGWSGSRRRRAGPRRRPNAPACAARASCRSISAGSAASSSAGTSKMLHVRRAVPFVLLSAIALSPILLVALAVGRPHDVAEARQQLRLGWVLIAFAWLPQLVLVAG